VADALTPGLRLETVYDPATGRSGTFELRVVNDSEVEVVADRLALTTIVPISARSGDPLAIVRRVSVYHEVGPGTPITIGPHAETVIGRVWCEFPAFHANDGPVSAFLIHADGTASALAVAEMSRLPGVPASLAERFTAGEPGAATGGAADGPAVGGAAGVSVPPSGGARGRALRLAGGGDRAAAVWAAMAAAERAVYGAGPLVLDGDAMGADAVTVAWEPGLGPGRFRLHPSAVGAASGVTAADEEGMRRALSALARQRRGEQPPLGAARYEWRGFHVDVARQWYPPATVAELIRIAGWYGLNRVHLHLTDDEGWRVPIAAFPALTEVGGWRGHGLPIPPLLGTGPARSGGSYTSADIAGWVATAAALGIELIPEVDLPAHGFAALAALPELRDPDDAGGAVSVQGFADNVLNPGVAATMPFLEQVLGEVADLFPGRWLHVGGDEVPDGAWLGSPAARRWAAARGVEGTRGIERAFMHDVIGIVRRLGRQVGVWQEAATCGALRPGDGYAIGWTSNEVNRSLAAAGYDVVAAPAQAYYLDMADRADWDAPGAFWAGVITPETVAAFDPTAGWTPAERARLRGVQACLWSEHVHDEAVLRRLLLPRLAVFADGTWEPEP
jgi:hexosaminidase